MFLYMYSVLGWGPFCLNDCINAEWHGADPPVAPLRCDGLVSLIFLLTIPLTFSLGFRSGEFAGQPSSNPGVCTFGSVGRCQVLLEKDISISIKLVSRKKHEVL